MNLSVSSVQDQGTKHPYRYQVISDTFLFCSLTRRDLPLGPSTHDSIYHTAIQFFFFNHTFEFRIKQHISSQEDDDRRVYYKIKVYEIAGKFTITFSRGHHNPRFNSFKWHILSFMSYGTQNSNFN